MPLYDYECSNCGHADTMFMSMRNCTDASRTLTCPSCSTMAYRRMVTLPHTDMKEFHTPIEMHSIALNHPEDIAAFKRLCPDVDCSMDENDPLYGVPMARTRKQKLQALQAAGFTEKK